MTRHNHDAVSKIWIGHVQFFRRRDVYELLRMMIQNQVNDFMQDLLEQLRERIITLCQRYGVIRLIALERLLCSQKDTMSGGADFIVEFKPAPMTISSQNHFAVQEALGNYVGHPIELMEYDPASSPYILSQSTKYMVLYAE